MQLIIRTATLAFVIEVRTTLLALGALLSLLGILGFFQAHGIWLPRIFLPTPVATAALLALSTMNIAVPIVTKIQAYRGTLAQFGNQGRRIARSGGRDAEAVGCAEPLLLGCLSRASFAADSPESFAWQGAAGKRPTGRAAWRTKSSA